jgi:uncharacterized SAM-binding protein YcdF (DUF218 family)
VPLYVAGSIWYSARNSVAVKSDVILVMGAAQFDGRPSDILQSRLKEKNWLINNGFKKSNILSITKGRDTLSSTQAYAAAMKKAKLNSVIIVTDPYHCFRSVKMASDLGLIASCDPVKTGPASVTNSGYKYLARETGAYLAYITVGRLGIKLSDRL